MALESSQRRALEAGRKVTDAVGRALGKAPEQRAPHANARRLIESRAGADSPESAEARSRARAALDRIEAGEVYDTSHYIETKVKEELDRKLPIRGMDH